MLTAMTAARVLGGRPYKRTLKAQNKLIGTFICDPARTGYAWHRRVLVFAAADEARKIQHFSEHLAEFSTLASIWPNSAL